MLVKFKQIPSCFTPVLSDVPFFYKDYLKNQHSPRRQEFNEASFTNVHDIVNAKNAAERIYDLEKTNLKLRRMIQYASIDKLNRPDSARLIETDRDIRFNLSGPPV